MRLAGKKIIVGITGSIAAYKSAILTRLLVKAGAEVKIIMTAAAKDFITPLTLSTLSKNPVFSDFYKTETGEWANHVELGLWADLMVIAPASANEVGKMANGLCDNLLTATYLSAKCKVMVAPAMDLDMYRHPSVTANFQKLQSFGNILIDAESGELASGLTGQGRMAEPEHIIEIINAYFDKNEELAGKKILLTVGPTREAIDPVRFISNHSSGKMGFAIAEELIARGAEVYIVSGPVAIPDSQVSNPRSHILKVNSAQEMYEACQKLFPVIDIAFFSAAVADYRPKEVAANKIKKNDPTLTVELVKNTDIAAEFGKIKKQNQLSIGFALETNNEFENASQKLARKNFDMVILNSMQDKNATFGHDTNKITILKKTGEIMNFDLKPKREVAVDIVNAIMNYE